MSDPEKPRTERRHSFRDSLLLGARCLIHDQGGEGGVEITVKLRNISAQGVMAEAPRVPAKDARISIELRNLGWVEGRVAWVQDNRFGILFAAQIDPSRVRHAPVEAQAAPAPMTRRPLGVRLRQIGAMPNALRRV
ncbi:PilZ domain-containing protein [Novosphingobium sp.]|uniref:PilZ domain-containing protein n=1 Tax=Novosphingobium sp. TaxID=1874826 RepID=UPI0031E465D3